MSIRVIWKPVNVALPVKPLEGGFRLEEIFLHFFAAVKDGTVA
jgi:hypothetical protein